MIKVVQLVYELSMGGAETVVKEYSLNFDKRIDNIILCCKRKNTPYETLLENAGVRIVYVSDFMTHFSKLSVGFRIFNVIQRYYLVRKILKRINPDIVHTHLLINTYLFCAGLKKNTRFVHTVHSEPNRYWKTKKIFNILDFYATKYLVKKREMQILVLHSKMKYEVDRLFKINNTIVLGNGIDFKRFEKVKAKNEVRQDLSIPQNAFVIGHVGRFIELKNHSFIVEIFNAMRKKNENTFLLLVGEGPLKEKIYNQLKVSGGINSSLILSNRTDIPDLLGAMDAFVFPSFHEGLPVSLIEAQKMNLPCFISDIITDEIKVTNLIEVCSLKQDADEWAKKILNYEINEIDNHQLEKWNIREIVKRLENIYFRLVLLYGWIGEL